jgi:hypothetical protein
MNIQTRFNVGDVVWTIHSNKAQKVTIHHICMKIDSGGINTLHYHAFIDGYNAKSKVVRTEDYLFASRQELMNSIIDEYED